MVDLSWMLYDTALFGTVDNTPHTLFQVAEGGDATHVADFTNMRGFGVLPSTEKFVARKIGVALETNATESDAEDWFLDGYLRLYLANNVVFQAPTLALISNTGFNGHFAQAAAANRALIGRNGNGYELDPQLVIGGGVLFKVELYQGTVVAANNTRVKVMLDGILTRP